MNAAESIAVVILIIAIVVLVYYFFLNNPSAANRLKAYVPTTADPHMDQILKSEESSDYTELSTVEEEKVQEEKEGMGKKIKVRLSDIDMSGFNTDAFSKKIDVFLDEKSDQLIQDWSLATLNDLETLEKKFDKTVESVDSLGKDFKKFKKTSKKFQEETQAKLDEIDKRIEALEK